MKFVQVCIGFITLCLVFYVLRVGSHLLLPLVMAVLIWFIINMLKSFYASASFHGRHLPAAVCFLLAIGTIALALYFLYELISANVSSLIEEAGGYNDKLREIIRHWFQVFHITETPELSKIIKNINFGSVVAEIAKALTNMAGRIGIVFIYLLFLFLEQASFKLKLNALFSDTNNHQKVFTILNEISRDVRTYFGIKTLTSAVTGIYSYLIMQSLGLDFAAFWALLIFFMNFIPTIGSIVATIFPSILALIQFDSFVPFAIIAGGITGLQFLIGNLLEPKLMGTTLNISPLVILLSLAFWGIIWGIPGMILCVPIVVISLIVCSHFPTTRPIAIMLSGNGKIDEH